MLGFPVHSGAPGKQFKFYESAPGCGIEGVGDVQAFWSKHAGDRRALNFGAGKERVHLVQWFSCRAALAPPASAQLQTAGSWPAEQLRGPETGAELVMPQGLLSP